MKYLLIYQRYEFPWNLKFVKTEVPGISAKKLISSDQRFRTNIGLLLGINRSVIAALFIKYSKQSFEFKIKHNQLSKLPNKLIPHRETINLTFTFQNGCRVN